MAEFLNEEMVNSVLEQQIIVNDKFYKSFLPSKEEILYKNPNIPWANNIIYYNLIEYGVPGSGKTNTANSIAGLAVDKYGEENVNCCFSEDGDLELLIARGLKPKMVNILFVDNATLTKQKDEVWMKWFRLRQRLAELYKQSNGYILAITSLHRYFGVNINLRSIIDGIIIKDISMNPYDKNALKKIIGNADLTEFAAQLSKHRIENRKPGDYSVYVSRTEAGILNLPPREKFHFKVPPTMIELLASMIEKDRLKKKQEQEKEKPKFAQQVLL